MGLISFKGVNKVYDSGVEAVKDFSLDIHSGEFIVLVGASGCGKTTVLRMLAGLEEVTSGEIVVDGIVINNLAIRRRDVAMVFQRYALFPHFSVRQNIAIGTKASRLTKEEADRRINEVADFMGILDLLNRRPNTLSGGQRQRVALARAIVREPKIFLLDEPLASLDAKLRTDMRSEIMRIKNRLKTTFIYVTHDQTEAMTMADRIVVMNEGRIEQIGTPSEIYNKPQNMFVAGFIGTPQMNFIRMENSDTIIGIRPDDIYIQNNEENNQNKQGDKQLGSSQNKQGDKQLGSSQNKLGDKQLGSSQDIISIPVIIDFIEETGGDSILHCYATCINAAIALAIHEKYKSLAIDKTKLTVKIKSGHQLKIGMRITLALDESKFHYFAS